MHETESTSHSYSREEFLSGQTLHLADCAVLEIFQMMLGMEVSPIAEPIIALPPAESSVKTAIVGFSGSMRGECALRMTTDAASAIACVMLDLPPAEQDKDTMSDVVGELCNMIAGGWKNRTPTLSRGCLLTPPCVISGHHPEAQADTLHPRLFQAYRFDDFTFHLTLIYENDPST